MFEDRLTRGDTVGDNPTVDDPYKAVEYIYDVWNRKIGRELDTNGDGTPEESEWYVYDAAGKRDGVTTVPLDDIILVFDDAGSLTTRYLHGPSFGQVLAAEELTGTSVDEVYWTLTDHQGSVRSLISHDGTGITVELHRTFDAFGNITSVDGSLNLSEFRYAYTGREWDTTTELQYNRLRWYDPTTGRWISEDPIGFAAGDMNLSRYVGNNTSGYVDPSGLFFSFSQYRRDVGRVFVGYGRAARNAAVGTYEMATDPIGTARNVGRAIANPKTTAKAIVNDFREKSQTLEGQGEIVGDVLIGILTDKGARSAVKKPSRIQKVQKAADKAASIARKVPGAGRIGRGGAFLGAALDRLNSLRIAQEFLGESFDRFRQRFAQRAKKEAPPERTVGATEHTTPDGEVYYREEGSVDPIPDEEVRIVRRRLRDAETILAEEARELAAAARQRTLTKKEKVRLRSLQNSSCTAAAKCLLDSSAGRVEAAPLDVSPGAVRQRTARELMHDLPEDTDLHSDLSGGAESLHGHLSELLPEHSNRGIVIVHRADGRPGHAFNAENIRGNIWIFEAQDSVAIPLARQPAGRTGLKVIYPEAYVARDGSFDILVDRS